MFGAQPKAKKETTVPVQLTEDQRRIVEHTARGETCPNAAPPIYDAPTRIKSSEATCSTCGAKTRKLTPAGSGQNMDSS
jgi:hypothetical protein